MFVTLDARQNEKEAIIHRLIELIEELLELRNFNTAASVLVGLRNNLCRGAGEGEIRDAEWRKRYVKVEGFFFGHRSGSKDRRSIQMKGASVDSNDNAVKKMAELGGIPWLDTLLCELTKLGTELDDQVDGGLIHFAKYRQVNGIIRDIVALQVHSSGSEVIECIQTWLKDLPDHIKSLKVFESLEYRISMSQFTGEVIKTFLLRTTQAQGAATGFGSTEESFKKVSNISYCLSP